MYGLWTFSWTGFSFEKSPFHTVVLVPHPTAVRPVSDIATDDAGDLVK
jgi:hypothetical protein